MKSTTVRNLSSRYFPSSRLSRIYENGKWLYTTDKRLDNMTRSDIAYFLRYGSYWAK